MGQRLLLLPSVFAAFFLLKVVPPHGAADSLYVGDGLDTQPLERSFDVVVKSELPLATIGQMVPGHGAQGKEHKQHDRGRRV